MENPVYLLQTPWNFIPSQLYSVLMMAAGVLIWVLFSKLDQRGHQEPGSEKRPTRRQLRKRIK